MRGSPLIRALIAFAVLLGLAPVLWKVTHPPVTAAAAPVPVAAAASEVEFALTFTTPARRVSITHLGREVWSKAEPGAREAAAIKLPWPREGVEIGVQCEWPAGTQRAAIRVQGANPGGVDFDRAVWSRGAAADEILTLP